MALNKDEFTKLSPEARMKKLKELEETSKKDLEEASDLIKRTEAEIEKEKSIPKIEVPELSAVDISRIFEQQTGLEATVKKEAPAEEEMSPVKYNAMVEQGALARTGYEDEDDLNKDKPMTRQENTAKYESAVEKADELTASRSALKNIKKYTMG